MVYCASEALMRSQLAFWEVISAGEGTGMVLDKTEQKISWFFSIDQEIKPFSVACGSISEPAEVWDVLFPRGLPAEGGFKRPLCGAVISTAGFQIRITEEHLKRILISSHVLSALW